MKCIHCDKETTNPKFCSKSCAAHVNNTIFPKRKLDRKCMLCDNIVKSYRHYRCEFHMDEWNEQKRQNWKTKTLGELRNGFAVRGKHPSWIHAQVRSYCRTWLRHLLKESCRHCGYSKHLELAHIKAISSFPDSATLGEVNSESNVIPLCPNCHWEFDNLPREEVVRPAGIQPAFHA